MSFYDGDIGNFVRDSKKSENVLFDQEDPRQFNITVDIAYEVWTEGHHNRTYQVVKNVPIIKKIYHKNKNAKNPDDIIDSKTCRLHYHGFYSEKDDECYYYLQSRKICLVLDQDSPQFKLLPNY